MINRGGLYARYFGKPERPAVTKTPKPVTEIKVASRKVGRPKKEGALSPAERAKAYRARRKANG
jgi:hypothetical protein